MSRGSRLVMNVLLPVLGGCFLTHGRSLDAPEPTAPGGDGTADPAPAPPSDGPVDGGVWTTPAVDAGPVWATCDAYVSGGRVGDRCTWGPDDEPCMTCTEPVDYCGDQPARRFIHCTDGSVEEEMVCSRGGPCGSPWTRCAAHADATHCGADSACEWYAAPPPCLSEPDDRLVIGPACVPKRGAACPTYAPSRDDACEGDQVCTGFGYDPCAGAACDACGAIDGYCTPPR